MPLAVVTRCAAKASTRVRVAAGQGLPACESDQTTHHNILDAQGKARSCPTTLNRAYGSEVVVAEASFLLHDEMDDCSAKAGSPNAYGLVGGAANAITPGTPAPPTLCAPAAASSTTALAGAAWIASGRCPAAGWKAVLTHGGF